MVSRSVNCVDMSTVEDSSSPASICPRPALLAVPSAGAAVASDLTLAQLSILVTLLDRGPIRMTDLAAHERVRTPTTTVAIRRLEKIGLVKRSRDPSDLRAVLVDITPRGLAVHRESLTNRITALAALLSQLSEPDLETLTQALAPLERLAASEPVTSPAAAHTNGDQTS